MEKSAGWSSFRLLNIAQFIGAMNDNIFKLLLVFCFIDIEGAASSDRILSVAGAVYVLPFIFLSSLAGVLADRYSKRSVIVATRIAELACILFGMVALGLRSEFLSFLTLFFLACHSAIFGPCKYGIVPEIVPSEGISKANGILTSFSYAAIIFGVFLASLLADITHKNYIIALCFCAVCSVAAIYSSWNIQRTPPAGLQKVTPWLVRELIDNLRVIRQEPLLPSAIVGSAFFLFIGSFIQLNMIPYSLKVLGLSDVQGGYMFLLAAFGIGVGSLLSGKLSGRSVEFGLVPVGGIGMAICCFLLDYYSDSLWTVMGIVFALGMFAGMFVVPLDSYIQVASPTTHRGRIVATGNIMSFCGVLLSALILYVMSILGISPDRKFTLIGFATLAVIFAISAAIFGYIVRFFSLVASYCFPQSSLKGKEQVPLDKPSIFFVPHAFWPWVMTLLASQRRRMRFLTLSPQSRPPFVALCMRRLIPIIEVNDVHDVFPDGERAELVRHAVERGTSVALFCSQRILSENAPAFIEAWAQDPVMQRTSFFAINVPKVEEKMSPQSPHIEKIAPGRT